MEEFTWVRIALAVAIHAIVLCVAAWDLAALASSNPGLTVSRLVQQWAIENPILPLAVGVTMGHLFWPVR